MSVFTESRAHFRAGRSRRLVPALRSHAWEPYVGWALTGAGAAMVPWLLALGTQLPAQATAQHWNTAWVGLDAMEALGLAGTGLLVRRRDPRAALPAAMTAALLLADAWFDVLTASPGSERRTAVLMAAGAEVPVAALCVVLAVRLCPRGPAGGRSEEGARPDHPIERP